MDRPLIIQTEALDAEARAWLVERGADVVVCPLNEIDDDLADRAAALVVRTYSIIDDASLARFPNLRVVGRGGVALDNIDVPACRARGVEVVHTPGANADAVAEYVFALLLDATRPRLFLDHPVGLRRWEELRAELQAPRELNELTLGIYGMGRIGTRVARIARGFRAPAVYHDVLEIPERERSEARPVSREQLLSTADIITVHVDDRPANRGLVSTDAFGRMKPGVIFISAARGLIVDPVAAAEFFVGHPSAQGIFDVHEPEPFPETHPLLDIGNVHLAPHIAAATAKARRNMSWVVRDVWRVLRDETPEQPAPR